MVPALSLRVWDTGPKLLQLRGLILFYRHEADRVIEIGHGFWSKVEEVQLPNFVSVSVAPGRVSKFSPVMSEERRPDGLLAKHAYSVLQAWIAIRG